LRRDTTKQRATQPAWVIALAFTSFAAMYWFQNRHHLLPYGWMEDLHVYAGAVRLFQSGVSPYYGANFMGLRFVYPPIALYAFRGLAALAPGNLPWTLFGFVSSTSVLLAPFVLARYYLRVPWLTPAMALLVWFGESRFTGLLALYSANVAPICYLACLLAGVPGLRRNRWSWFYVVVMLAAMVKITFLVMLLFPVFAGRRQWWPSIGSVLSVGLLYALEARLFPGLYAGYKWALLQQLSVEKQFGYGVFGVVAWIDEMLKRPVSFDPFAVQALFVIVLLGMLLWLRLRGADLREPGIWLGLLLMAVILVNPRMLHYDAYLALFAAYVVLALTLDLEGVRLVALLWLLFAPSLIMPHLIRSGLMYRSYDLIVILIALVAGIWRLWQRTRLEANAPEDDVFPQSMVVQNRQ
jgi:hypothetical protein